MSGLVIDLQRDALDKATNVDDLLRKARVVSKKLDIEETRIWIDLELGGYNRANRELNLSLAPYRLVHGELKARNPYHGWQPVYIGDNNTEHLTTLFVDQSMAEIADLVKKADMPLISKFDGPTAQRLMNAMNVQLEPALFIPSQAFLRILDTVRNRILDWALDLEARDIIGSGMSFSGPEKLAASQITYSTVNNIGSMSNSQLQQHSSGWQSNVVNQEIASQLRLFLTQLEQVVTELKLSGSAQAELTAEMGTLRAQLDSPKPKTTVIREAMSSARQILEGCAGNVLASGLVAQIGPLLSALPT